MIADKINSNKGAYKPVDITKLDPQVARALKEAIAVNKALHIDTTKPVKISGFNGFYDLNDTLVSTRPEITQPVPPPYPTGDAGYVSASQMKFNLPPHNWSLPVSLNTLTNMVTAEQSKESPINHDTRRAIMWFYASSTSSQSKAGIIQPANPGADKTDKGSVINKDDNYWGFQFLWNPKDFTSILTRNANVIPSSLDAHSNLSGLFTAMEALSFTIVIDRVNDFACFKAASPLTYGNNTQYYGKSFGVQQTPENLIKELMQKGTMADIEYLFKMINGSGITVSSGQLYWQNALNRTTSDLSFLSPTAIALQLGPDANNNLSYVGWIESLSIKHTMFTEDMLPLHTDIDVMFNAFSRVALTSRAG
jgi:hypothetical protein